MATAVTVFASAPGAAWKELAEIDSEMVAAVEVTPCFRKKARSFSTARPTRILAASSLLPRELPTSFMLLR